MVDFRIVRLSYFETDDRQIVTCGDVALGLFSIHDFEMQLPHMAS
jgi:hypothetical protein